MNYAAPEILSGGDKVQFNKSVDLFTFGIVMNEFITYEGFYRTNSFDVIFIKNSPIIFNIIKNCISK